MENGNSQRKKIQVFSVISIFVFLADIYLIVNMKDNYLMLGLAALARGGQPAGGRALRGYYEG